MDLPDSISTKINYYPQTPRETNSMSIGKDGDYSKWSWNDSFTVEYFINLNGEQFAETDIYSYQIVNDTIILEPDSMTVSKYGFEIVDNQLILNGYTDSQLNDINNYQYINLI
jgi:hypothetical protein